MKSIQNNAIKPTGTPSPKPALPQSNAPQTKPPGGIRPEFQAMLTKFESDFGVDFTKKEEKKIEQSSNPAQTAQQIAKSHHSGFQSRAGGKFGPGKVGAQYYKQGKP